MNAHQHARFGRLRSALQRPPSAEAWGEVIHNTREWPEAMWREVVEPYALAHLRGWPDALRVLTSGLRRQLVRDTAERGNARGAGLATRWHLPLDNGSVIVRHAGQSVALRGAREVTIGAGRLDLDDLRTLTTSPHAANIERAHMQGLTTWAWQTAEEVQDYFAHLAALPALRALRLSSALPRIAPEALASLGDAPHLRSLWIEHTIMLDEHINAITARLAEKLDALHIGRQDLHWSSDRARFHAAMRRLIQSEGFAQTMQTFAVRDNGYMDALIDALAESDAPALRDLTLGTRPYTGDLIAREDWPVTKLTTASWWPQLERMTLRFDVRSMALMQAIADGAPCPPHLHLTSSRHTPPDQSALIAALSATHLDTLHTLDLSGIAVDERALLALRANDALPALRVVRLRTRECAALGGSWFDDASWRAQLDALEVGEWQDLGGPY